MRTGIYRHYKGGYYLVLGVAAHSETDERFVIYVSLNWNMPGLRMRARPYNMFNETLLDVGKRFKYVGEAINEEKQTEPIN